MLGDENCLFHVLGHYARQTQQEVRRALAMEASEGWQEHFGWGLDDEFWAFLVYTAADGVWGDGMHLALASRVSGARTRVTRGLDYTLGRDGPEWR